MPEIIVQEQRGDSLRKAMRDVPSAVTVVTAAAKGEMRGITIGSFTSVSLEPPLICFNVSREAAMFPIIMECSHFVVHLLRENQTDLSNHFAIPDLSSEDQFIDVSFTIDENRTPVLDDALSLFFCKLHSIHQAGDHVIVVGEVTRTISKAGKPLVYYDRRYVSVGVDVESPRSTVKRGSSVRL